MKYVLSLLLIFSVYFYISFLFLTTDPPIHPDETFFYNTAFNINSTGIVRTTLFADTAPGFVHIRNYSYPPFFQDLSAIWLHLFGSSIVSVRLLPVTLGAAVILFFWLYLNKTTNYLYSFLAAFVLIFITPFQISSRTLRPEIGVLFFLMIGLSVVVNSMNVKLKAVVLGLVSVSAGLCHVLGFFVPIFLYGYWFLYNEKEAKQGKLLFLVGLFLGSLYCVIRYIERVDLVYEQFILQWHYKQNRSPLINQLFEQSLMWRFLLLFSLVFSSVSIFIGYLKQHRKILFLGLFVFFTFLLNFFGKEQWYLLYICISVLFLVVSYMQKTTNKIRIFGVIGLIILISFFCYDFTRVLGRISTSTQSYEQFVTELEKYLPKDARILVSTLPDPTISLVSKGYNSIYGLLHISQPRATKEYFDSFDVMIINYVTNPELKNYLNTTELLNSVVIEKGGFNTTLIFIKSKTNK